MRKLIFTVLLILAMAVPVMALDITPDIKLEGDVNLGYVFADSYNVNVNDAPFAIDTEKSGSKWGYMVDLKTTWKNKIRPWVYLQGISGYSSENSWAIVTRTMGVGVDYLFYETKYGTAYIRGSYTNWKTEVNTDFMGNALSASPTSETWMASIGWKF